VRGQRNVQTVCGAIRYENLPLKILHLMRPAWNLDAIIHAEAIKEEL